VAETIAIEAEFQPGYGVVAGSIVRQRSTSSLPVT
jgi:hypothetical protein